MPPNHHRSNRPEDEAYGRVTDPDRFQAVVDAARDVVDRLTRTYRVTRSEVAPSAPRGRVTARRAIRLEPPHGAPLVFEFPDFPGVHLRFGAWGREAFPGCGCDGCAEDPGDEIDRMLELIEAVTSGGYEERLTKRVLETSMTTRRTKQAGRTRLERGEWRRLGAPGTHRWPAWPIGVQS